MPHSLLKDVQKMHSQASTKLSRNKQSLLKDAQKGVSTTAAQTASRNMHSQAFIAEVQGTRSPPQGTVEAEGHGQGTRPSSYPSKGSHNEEWHQLNEETSSSREEYMKPVQQHLQRPTSTLP